MTLLPGIDTGENDLQDRLANFGIKQMFTDDDRFNIRQTGFNIVRNRLDKSKQQLLFTNGFIDDSDLWFIWKRFNAEKKDARKNMRN